MAQFRVIRLSVSVSIELELCLILPKSSSPSPLHPRNGVQSLLPLSDGTHKLQALLISSASLLPPKATACLDYNLLLPLLSGAPLNSAPAAEPPLPCQECHYLQMAALQLCKVSPAPSPSAPGSPPSPLWAT